MSQQELLKRVINILEYEDITYMLTGSVVSSMQGEPRTTHDIDIVFNIEENRIKKLLKSFSKEEYYIDEKSIKKAVRNRKMFNIIDFKTGDKVDFWLFTGDSFDKSRFSRRKKEEFVGLNMQVSSPEDTILAKLRWAKRSGGSEKQFTDALRVYEVQYGKLDLDYISCWAKKLDIEKLWAKLKEQAEPIKKDKER